MVIKDRLSIVFIGHTGGIATAVTVSFHPWFAMVDETK